MPITSNIHQTSSEVSTHMFCPCAMMHSKTTSVDVNRIEKDFFEFSGKDQVVQLDKLSLHELNRWPIQSHVVSLAHNMAKNGLIALLLGSIVAVRCAAQVAMSSKVSNRFYGVLSPLVTAVAELYIIGGQHISLAIKLMYWIYTNPDAAKRNPQFKDLCVDFSSEL